MLPLLACLLALDLVVSCYAVWLLLRSRPSHKDTVSLPTVGVGRLEGEEPKSGVTILSDEHEDRILQGLS